MTKDGDILEQLVKIDHGYEAYGVKIYSLPVLHFEKVNYTKFMEIKILAKKLKANAIFRVEGNLDTVNLLGHPEQYHITLKKAFNICNDNKLGVGCSITFRRNI